MLRCGYWWRICEKRPGLRGNSRLLLRSRLLAEISDHFEVGSRGLCDLLWLTGIDCGEVDEVAADPERACTGMDESPCGLKCDAARRDQLEERKWREKRFEIACPAHRRAGEDLYVFCAGSVCGDHFRRRESAGDGELAVAPCHLDYFWVKTRADNEFSTCVDGGLGFGGGSDSPRTEEKARAVFLLEFFEQFNRSGHGHGDFDDGHASGDHRLDDGVGLCGSACAEDWDEAYAFDYLCSGFRHSQFHSRLAGDTGAAALHGAFHFGKGSHAGVTGCGHGECAVSYATAYCPIDRLAGEQPVDEARGEAVATADAVKDVDFDLGHVDDLILKQRDRTPRVPAGGGGGAEGAGNEFEIRVGCGKFAQHICISGDREF